MRLSLRLKILIGFLVVLILLGIVAFISQQGLRDATAKYADLSGRVNLVAVKAQQMEAIMLDEARAITGYLISYDAEYREDFNLAAKRGEETLQTLKDLVQSDQGREILGRLEASKAQYEQAARPILERTNLSNSEKETILSVQLRPIRSDVSTEISGLLALASQLNTSMSDEAETAASSARNVGLAFTGIAMALGIAIALWLSAMISHPVQQVAAIANHLAQGNLQVTDLRVTSRDEVGEMAQAVNQMVHQLRDLVSGVTSTSHSLMAASEELVATSEQSAKAAETAASAAGLVSAGATEQSSAAAEVHRIMEELQQTIQQIAVGAQSSSGDVAQASDLLARIASAMDAAASSSAEVAGRADEAARTAREGANVVHQSISGMKRIEAAVGDSATKIRELEQYSAQINEITEVIAGIADQTNLLALNAAIEAARAGEHGRGFAVVAEEVRRLAERSSAATREISGLIGNIQSRTTNVVHAMDVAIREVETGNRLAGDAGESLSRILSVVSEASVGIQEIARSAQQVRANTDKAVQAFQSAAALAEENTAATEEMAASASLVLQSMDTVTTAANQNASAAQDVSSTVEELTAASEEVASSAISLTQMAEALQSQVSRFRL